MNNGRIWCVVSPTVGLPLFLGSVAVIAFTVHFAVLNNTTWFANFMNGGAGAIKKVASTDAPASVAQATAGDSRFSIDVQPAASASNTSASAFVVTVTPKNDSAASVKAVVALQDAR